MADPRSAFDYTPLPNASTHMRLLKLSKFWRREDGIQCQLSTHSLSDAPPYIAISYAWGQGSWSSNISMNGRSAQAKGNSLYVLQQARNYDVDQYFWMNQLCINQHDSDEKSLQVQLMGQIFASAKLVLVSLGQHDEMSRYLTSFLGSLRNVSEDVWAKDISAHPERARLSKGLYDFHARPYWTRVWIIQEILMAQRVVLLCGWDQVDWEAVNKVISYFNYPDQDDPADVEFTSRREYGYVGSSTAKFLFDTFQKRRRGEQVKFTLRDVLAFKDQKCADAFGHVYGFLHLLEKSEKSIIADYRLSTWDLATQILNYLISVQQWNHLSTLKPILTLLCLDSTALHNTPQEMVRRTCFIDPGPDVSMTQEETAPEPWTTQKVYFSQDQAGQLGEMQLRRNQCWRITEDLRVDERLDGPDSSQDANRRLESAVEDNVKTWSKKPIILKRNHATVALLCHGARPGDYLLRMEDRVHLGPRPRHRRNELSEIFHACLVVRQYRGDVYEFVGQALMNSRWCISDPSEHIIDDLSNIVFDLNFDAEDFLVFASQDLRGQKIEMRGGSIGAAVELPVAPREPWGPLERLHTGITAARFSSYAVARSHSSLSVEEVKVRFG